MKTRVLSTVVILPLVILSIWVGGLLFSSVILVVSLIASQECSRLLATRNFNSHAWMSSLLSGLIIALGFYLSTTSYQTVPITLGFTLLTLLAVSWMLMASAKDGSIINKTLSTLTPSLYPAGLLMQAPLIMGLDQGLYWLIILITGTSMTDTGAYLIGKKFGSHPFFQKISPSKTIEGAISGLICGGVTLALISTLLPHLHLSGLQIAILSMTFPIVAQAGDLIESALKRQSSVKDSGNIIPGHGGVLDRLDSIVFNVALLYHFIKWIGT